MTTTTITIAKGLVAVPLVDEETSERYGFDLHLENDLLTPVAENFGTLAECREYVAQDRRAFPAALFGRRWRPSDLLGWH